MQPMIKIQVRTIHPETPHMEAYRAIVLDIEFAEGDVGHTALAASDLIRNLQSMYAGDQVEVTVWLWGESQWVSEGMMGREDEGIVELARMVERWGG